MKMLCFSVILYRDSHWGYVNLGPGRRQLGLGRAALRVECLEFNR
jgi:hypothetical protein